MAATAFAVGISAILNAVVTITSACGNIAVFSSMIADTWLREELRDPVEDAGA
jgi:hypothetical protein